MQNEIYKTIREVLEETVKAYQKKTGSKSFSPFPTDGLALDPANYNVYLKLVDKKGNVKAENIGPIKASTPFFYSTSINTNEIDKNGYKFVCQKVVFNRPDNYKETIYINCNYEYFCAEKIQIVKAGTSSFNPVKAAAKLYKEVKYEYPKARPLVMDKVKSGSDYIVDPYLMDLSGETIEEAIKNGDAKLVTIDHNYEILVGAIDKLTWYDVMKYIPTVTLPSTMDIKESNIDSITDGQSGIPEYDVVFGMSWYDAIYCCNELSKRDGFTPCYSVNNKTDATKWGYKPGKGNSIKGTIKCDESANGYRLPTSDEYDYYRSSFKGEEYHAKGWKNQLAEHNEGFCVYKKRAFRWLNDNIDKANEKTAFIPGPGGAEIKGPEYREVTPNTVYANCLPNNNTYVICYSSTMVVRTVK